MAVYCKRCHRSLATGLWLLTDKNGKEEYKVLCGGCGLGFYPTTSYTIKLLAQFPSPDGPEVCKSPLKPTGTITKAPASVFFELQCPKCGYLADFPTHKVTNALREHTHEVPSPTAPTGDEEEDDRLSDEFEV